MFTQQTIMPLLGQGPEVRAQLTDWAKHGQSKGRLIFLSPKAVLYRGSGFHRPHVGRRPGGLGQDRPRDAGHADFQSRFARAVLLLADVPRTVVLERLLAPPIRTGTFIYQLVSFAPATGATPGVRQKLEGFVKNRQANGATVALWQRVFSSDGPSFSVLSRFADLGELDAYRQGGQQAVIDLGLGLAEQLHAPPQIRISELIVPLPS